ncbi:MAG: hypothetical protein II534_05375 [Clostridia bacterium]|nr:hypothetical protein [Clostridia bacterium]
MAKESELELKNFSLIYPDEASLERHYESKDRPDISDFVSDELGLSEIFNLKNGSLADFFTVDQKVIEYRAETFQDMLDNPGLIKTLNNLLPILNDIMELRRLEADSGDTNDYLSSITEIELYISSVDTLDDGLNSVRDGIKGAGFRRLLDYISELAESDYYSELNERLFELTKRVRDIRSVTVGVNLDAQLRPAEAGVLSINPEQFRSGDVIEKILRLNFKNDEYTCIASLVPFGKKESENRKAALSNAFNSAINEVYRSSLRSWKKIIQQYVLEKTDFLLNLVPEIEFLIKGTRLMQQLKERGYSLCYPEIAPASECAFEAYGLYNPQVALKIGDEIVPNDLVFDDKARIYVLSGPNRGGKSVITCALGIAQAMMQLGLPVPAERARISPADGIFTHFPTGADDTIDKGRLGEECARLGQIFERVTEHSLVLLDESLSSTGAYEASYIAAEVLEGFSAAGCRTLFSTHLHELSAFIPEINARSAEYGGKPIDTLVAGMDSGKRSFRIYRTKPDGKSYARDIAYKYGLSHDSIISKINSQKTGPDMNG